MEHQLHAQQNEQTPVDSIFLAENPPTNSGKPDRRLRFRTTNTQSPHIYLQFQGCPFEPNGPTDWAKQVILQLAPKPANPRKTQTDDPKTYHLSAILIGVVRHDVKISAGRSAFCGRIS